MTKPGFLITSGLPPIYSYVLENVPHCAFKAHLKVLPFPGVLSFLHLYFYAQWIFILRLLGAPRSHVFYCPPLHRPQSLSIPTSKPSTALALPLMFAQRFRYAFSQSACLMVPWLKCLTQWTKSSCGALHRVYCGSLSCVLKMKEKALDTGFKWTWDFAALSPIRVARVSTCLLTFPSLLEWE